eukprot:scaffold117654_cov40-Prasinocladus_malaysianus.AAC.2
MGVRQGRLRDLLGVPAGEVWVLLAYVCQELVGLLLQGRLLVFEHRHRRLVQRVDARRVESAGHRQRQVHKRAAPGRWGVAALGDHVGSRQVGLFILSHLHVKRPTDRKQRN